MEILRSADAFKALVKSIKEETLNYKNPIAFGICRVDTEVTYLIVNSNENFGSAAIFIKALSEQGIDVDFNECEAVCNVNKAFLSSSLNAFAPYIGVANGETHKNIQVVLALKNEFMSGDYLDYKVVFLFADDAPKSLEAIELKKLS